MKTYIAGGTIRRARFVNLDTSDNFVILEADANEIILGVSHLGGADAPIPSVTANPAQWASGDHVPIFIANDIDGPVYLEIGTGGVTSGDEIESDADGKGVKKAATAASVRHIGAIALETRAAGELCRVMLRNYTHTNPA